MTPIFVTEKPNLYSDMYRDLSDIGMADMADKILMTNANETVPLTSDGSKELKTKAGHNSILKKATQDGEASRRLQDSLYYLRPNEYNKLSSP